MPRRAIGILLTRDPGRTISRGWSRWSAICHSAHVRGCVSMFGSASRGNSETFFTRAAGFEPTLAHAEVFVWAPICSLTKTGTIVYTSTAATFL